MNTLRSHIIKQHNISKSDADGLIVSSSRSGSSDSNVDERKSEPVTNSSNNDSQSSRMKPESTVKDTEYYTVHSVTVVYSGSQDESCENQMKRAQYQCKVCSKVMSHKSNMEDHVRSHSGVKLFQCKLCGKGLSRKQNLVHHLKHVHYMDSAHIEQNIVRMNEPSSGKKVKKQLYGAESGTDKIKNVEGKNSDSDLNDLNKNGEKEHISTDCKVVHTKENDNKTLFDSNKQVKSPYFQTEVTSWASDSVSCDGLPELQGVVSSEGVDSVSDAMAKLDEACFRIMNQTNNEQGPAADTVADGGGQQPVTNEESLLHPEPGLGDEEDDQTSFELEEMFTVVNPSNPVLKRYRCNICDFECKRRYYMTQEHVLKHTNYKPYLCVICCKAYNRKNTLKGHISKEHKIDGSELEDIMATTGTKLNVSLPMSKKTSAKTILTTDHMDMSTSELDMSTFEPESNVDKKRKRTADEISSLANYDQDGTETKGNSDEHVSERSLDKIDSCEVVTALPKDSDTSIVIREERQLRKKRKAAVAKDVEMVYTSSEGPESSGSGALPGFLTSLYNMINHRQPKRACQFSNEIGEFMDLKTMTCKKCNKKCSNKSNLKQHIKFVHLNLKEFACYVCGKKFNTKFNLKVHWKQHSDLCETNLKEDFVCSKCGKVFTTRSYLRVHLINKHGESRPGEDQMWESGAQAGQDEDRQGKDFTEAGDSGAGSLSVNTASMSGEETSIGDVDTNMDSDSNVDTDVNDDSDSKKKDTNDVDSYSPGMGNENI